MGVSTSTIALIMLSLIVAGLAVAYGTGYLAVVQGNYVSRYLDLGDDFIYAVAASKHRLVIVIPLDVLDAWCFGAVVGNHRAILYVNGERVKWRTVECIEPYYTFWRYYRIIFPDNSTRAAFIEFWDMNNVFKYGDGLYEISVTYVYGNSENEKMHIVIEVRDGKIYAGGLSVEIVDESYYYGGIISDWLVIKSLETSTTTSPQSETSTSLPPSESSTTTTTAVPSNETQTTTTSYIPPPRPQKNILEQIAEFFRSIIDWFRNIIPF